MLQKPSVLNQQQLTLVIIKLQCCLMTTFYAIQKQKKNSILQRRISGIRIKGHASPVGELPHYALRVDNNMGEIDALPT